MNNLKNEYKNTICNLIASNYNVTFGFDHDGEKINAN